MARLEGLKDSEAGFLTRQALAAARRLLGQVPEPMRLMARSKSVFWAAGFYEMFSKRGRSVSAELKTLASVKAAMGIGCVF